MKTRNLLGVCKVSLLRFLKSDFVFLFSKGSGMFSKHFMLFVLHVLEL